MVNSNNTAGYSLKIEITFGFVFPLLSGLQRKEKLICEIFTKLASFKLILTSALGFFHFIVIIFKMFLHHRVHVW